VGRVMAPGFVSMTCSDPGCGKNWAGTNSRPPVAWIARALKGRQHPACVATAGKQINGRRRHLLVDKLGLLLGVAVTVASVQDRDGARLLLRNLPGHCKKLRKIWVDGGYSGRLVQWVGMLQILPDCRIASKRNAWLYFAA
jgi:hypothetical protein